jgi:lipoprotein-releasing system permease protein
MGLGAAIVAFLIMNGFRDTIKDKIYSFSSHLIITKFTMNNSTEEQPFMYNTDFYKHPGQFGFIDHVQEFSHKPGLIKAGDEVLGVVIKGVGKSFNLKQFGQNIIDGEFIHFPDSGYANEVVISKNISDKINAGVGDDIIVHFFQNPPRFRRLKVTGIYETNLSEYFDKQIIIADLRLLQRLNGSADSVAGGLEVFIKDADRAEEALVAIGKSMDYDLYIEKVSDKYQPMFEWLGVISRQVNILLGIILIVVSVNMISVVLILVMERTPMIGVLKAMGATNKLIRSVFVFNGINLVFRGLLYGNLLGLGVCFLQDKFKIVTLNPRDYYMSYAPVSWNWGVVLLLNVLVLVIVTLVLLLPTAVVSRISPIKAIKFD